MSTVNSSTNIYCNLKNFSQQKCKYAKTFLLVLNKVLRKKNILPFTYFHGLLQLRKDTLKKKNFIGRKRDTSFKLEYICFSYSWGFKHRSELYLHQVMILKGPTAGTVQVIGAFKVTYIHTSLQLLLSEFNTALLQKI